MNKIISLIFIFSLLHLTTATAEDKYQSTNPAFGIDRDAVSIISNTELAASLVVGEENTRVSGRMSLNLNASRKDLQEGILRVAGWNVAMFSVPQGPISGRNKVKESEGILGFAASSKDAVLHYDPEKNIIKGEIKGYIDTSYLATLVKVIDYDKRAGSADFFETATQPATLQVEIALEKSLKMTKNQEINHSNAKFKGVITIKPMIFEDKELPGYKLMFDGKELKLKIAPWWRFEIAKGLCVQPVRIGAIRVANQKWGWPIFSVGYTGDGLAFGQPGVTTQWNKADVVFTYRKWKTIYKPGYWVTSDAGTEEESLLAEVDDDDCIEVFFVNDFDPEDAHGGGAAWGGGVAGSKIITSDANARYGIDFTHLAHELGHVIGLHHPNAAPTANLTPASTGTLMCPSGFKNDNPTINSQENKDNVSNPLFTFAIKLRTAGPDCQNDADCGPCPPIP